MTPAEELTAAIEKSRAILEQIRKLINKDMIKVGNYYDNSHLCGECTGGGCKQCGYTGVLTFPVSSTINGCKPPAIENTYAWKFTKANYKKHRI